MLLVAMNVSQLGGAVSADVNFYHIILALGIPLVSALAGILAFVMLVGIFIRDLYAGVYPRRPPGHVSRDQAEKN